MSSARNRVLFVCMGNICRSPTAEGVLSQLIVQRGLQDDIAVDSAGTDAYHVGERADPRMRAAAALRGYELTSIARQITRDDFDAFDLVVAMDRDNLRRLEGLADGHPPHLRLLSDFLPGEDDGAVDVPDPYYGGPQGFETVLDMIEEACPAILDSLLDA